MKNTAQPGLDRPGTVRQLIALQAGLRPSATYAVDAETGAKMGYGDLELSCRQVGALLTQAGAHPGETVSVVMPNGMGTLRLILGALYSGWCVNPVNLLSNSQQLHYVLDHSDCSVVLVSPLWEAKVREALELIQRPIRLLRCDEHSLRFDTSLQPITIPEPSPAATALLMYTSGTTGLPKGVMLTHANLVANAHAISTEHHLGPSDRVLAVLPLYHINAFTVTMLAPLAQGGSLAMPAKFSATRFWQQAREQHCTWINVVPTMISYLLEGQTPGHDLLRGIRFCRSASAALPVEHLHAFEARFGIRIVETMGLTETAAPSFSNPMDATARKPGSVGRASGCRAQVIDAQLRCLPDGQTGEIVIQGPQVMKGYYKNEAATREAFTPDGWLRTGDLGHRDADGYFFITGRIKELIIKGGENIAPREIDEWLLQHPAILEAAVVGIPDKHYGQEIRACVILREGHVVDARALSDFCTEKLGRYKTPKEFHFVQELPRGPSGKVQRLKLLEL
jgi:acyl-CoA synthetase (AMP-forming)/AMP-acid ligase II